MIYDWKDGCGRRMQITLSGQPLGLRLVLFYTFDSLSMLSVLSNLLSLSSTLMSSRTML